MENGENKPEDNGFPAVVFSTTALIKNPFFENSLESL
jgi:hypothetical protein